MSPLWTAALDHIRLDSTDPAGMAAFYQSVMGMRKEQIDDDLFLLSGHERRLLVGRGSKNDHPFSAWHLESRGQVDALRKDLGRRNVEMHESPTPLFDPGAFCVRDPDGRFAVFGVPRSGLDDGGKKAQGLPARLQHVVVASAQLAAMRAFYEGQLGFDVSDVVYDNEEGTPQGEAKVCFFRANKEHHSLAVFTGSNARHDHHCYETNSWNDLRDWLDFLGERDIAAWWGPGRHGPGNNVFFMIKDPDGNNIELSAELEVLEGLPPPRAWPNSRRMYNLWGSSWVRS